MITSLSTRTITTCGTRNSLTGIGFQIWQAILCLPNSFDLRFNRPDIVLKRLGLAPPNVVNSLSPCLSKASSQNELYGTELGTEIHLPEIRIITEGLPLATAEAGIRFDIEAADSPV